MEQVDPALLEMVQGFVTEGGEQWQALATELGRKAMIMIYFGLSVFGFGQLMWPAVYLTRNRDNEAIHIVPMIAGCVFTFAGIVIMGTHMGDAMAPMNGVLENVMRGSR